MTETLPTGLLALPGPEERSMPALKHKLRLLALRRLLLLEPATSPATPHRALGRLLDFLRELAASPSGKELTRCIGNVDVLAPLLAIESNMVRADDWIPRLVPALLVALARALPPAARRDALVWDVPVERIVDDSQGEMLEFEPPALGLLLDASGIEARTIHGDCNALQAGAPHLRRERVGFRLRQGPTLSLVDTNPLAMLEEHPDKAGNAVDLGERDVQVWQDALEAAFAIVHAALPPLAAEIARDLQRIVPVGHHAEKHLSASYREAPGLVYLSLHPSPLTMAEALVHETQHGKLNTLRWFDAVLDNGDSTWTPSPVRPDLRPLFGVLMAVHAFVPVAALHFRLHELKHPVSEAPEFETRVNEVLEGNAHGLATLRRLGRPTKLGSRVIDALEQLHVAVGGRCVDSDDHAPLSAL